MPTSSNLEPALNDTQNVLIEMLTENTGRALCDSGGTPRYDSGGKYIGSEHGYGRAWERNSGRRFVDEAEAAAILDLANEGKGYGGSTRFLSLRNALNRSVTKAFAGKSERN